MPEDKFHTSVRVSNLTRNKLKEESLKRVIGGKKNKTITAILTSIIDHVFSDEKLKSKILD